MIPLYVNENLSLGEIKERIKSCLVNHGMKVDTLLFADMQVRNHFEKQVIAEPLPFYEAHGVPCFPADTTELQTRVNAGECLLSVWLSPYGACDIAMKQ